MYSNRTVGRFVWTEEFAGCGTSLKCQAFVKKLHINIYVNISGIDALS